MKKVLSNFELFLVAIGVVLVWRGVWGLSDLYLFPNNDLLSFVVSIAIGIFILYGHTKSLKRLL